MTSPTISLKTPEPDDKTKLSFLSGFFVSVVGTVVVLFVAVLLFVVRDEIVPRDPEQFWAFVGAAASIGVLVIAYRGLKSIDLTLKSIDLTRKDMLNRAHRDARESAIARCEEFAQVIIPMSVPVNNGLAKNRIPVFVHDSSEVQFDPDNQSDLKRAEQWYMDLPGELNPPIMQLLNRLEAWAMPFVCGVADQKIAFEPCSPPFCAIVVQLYPVLLHQRNKDAASGKYPNVVKLFQVWSEDLKVSELLHHIEKVQRKGIPTAKLQLPLGTDLDEI